MQSLSIVIVCKNEADVIGKTLKSLMGLTDDIVIYDNGSTDGTQEIVKSYGVTLVEGEWEGFGKTKRKAVKLAKYDWVLSLDADEMISEELRKNLQQLESNSDSAVYEVSFRNYFGSKPLKYGEWGWDKHVRLFNRRKVNWDDAAVHEGLILPDHGKILQLKGHILHQTVKNISDYVEKMTVYALLSASKYHQQGKRSSWFKINVGPTFVFVKYYFFQLGFLDGWEGFICAKMTSFYTFLKYAKLKELNKQMRKLAD